tara:strand:+ start:105368 stop:106096 length:729 start_codon:yes stop_codon:yes gene_type:complete
VTKENVHRVFVNWSSGKDATLALYKLLQDHRYDVERLLTTVNKSNKRINMHGLHVSLLEAQAKAIGIPLDIVYLTEQLDMEIYADLMKQKLKDIQQKGVNTSVFGDIFLEDLKKYREQQLAGIKMKGLFPLWKQSTEKVIREFIDLGFKAIVVSIDDQVLDKSFCGRMIDEKFIQDLPKDIDPCGENGEFHTFCFDGPIFTKPVEFKLAEKIYKTYPAPSGNENNLEEYGFWFQDLVLKNPE